MVPCVRYALACRDLRKRSLPLVDDKLKHIGHLENVYFGRLRCRISCSAISFRFCITARTPIMLKLILKHERTSLRVSPHYVPAKFLFPMRRKDHSPALASLDKSEVLRSLSAAVPARALAGVVAGDCHFRVPRFYFRSCVKAKPSASGHQTNRACADITTTNSTAYRPNSVAVVPAGGTGLYLRRAHEERHSVLPPSTWAGALLAAQGYAGDVASGKVDY